MGKHIKNMIILFLVGIVLLFLLMVLISLIPNEAILQNQQKSLSLLNTEGEYPSPFFGTRASQLDNVTDMTILRQMLKQPGDSLLQAAMTRSYARYWNGYSVFIRPLLVFFDITQIRYILMLVFFLLFGAAAVLLGRKTNIPTAIAFVVSIAMTYPVVIAISMQFAPVFLISFVAIILLLSKPEKVLEYIPEFFLIIGMVTNFIDFLTVPVVTLGLPLIVCLLISRNILFFKDGVRSVLVPSVCWGLGYALTWLMKWVLGTLILGANIFSEAEYCISFRVMGSEQYPASRLLALKDNISVMFLSRGRLIACIFVLLIVLVLILGLLHRKKETGSLIRSLCILLLAVFPYLWYLVLSNHSIVHNFFTYRAQAVTVFAVLAYGISRNSRIPAIRT